MTNAPVIDDAVIRRWLLEALVPGDVSGPRAATHEGSHHWDRVIAVASRHRAVPLLHWRIRESQHAAGRVPPEVVDMLQREMMASTQANLVMLGAVRQIDDAFSAAGIPALFLKGVHLAAAIYPQPGLRPMRDIDVLVPRVHLRDAVAALKAIGARVGDQMSSDFHARRHHVPAIELPSWGVRVEVHWMLRPPHESLPNERVAAPAFDELNQRGSTIGCAGRSIRVLSHEDLLLHLVGHAVRDHRFSNGPLVLADIDFLLQARPLDWSLLWRLAESQGIVRECVLLLRLLERRWGARAIEWCGRDEQVEDAVLDAVMLLMLQESVLATNLAAARKTAAVGGAVPSAIQLAARRMFAPRRDMALMYPVKADSLAAFAWYPRHWWRLVTKRLPEYLRYRRQPGVDLDVKSLDVVEAWLTGPTAPPGRAIP